MGWFLKCLVLETLLIPFYLLLQGRTARTQRSDNKHTLFISGLPMQIDEQALLHAVNTAAGVECGSFVLKPGIGAYDSLERQHMVYYMHS